MAKFTETQLELLLESDEYSDYICANAGGDRIICNGDTLLCAMEDGYLFPEFLASLETE